MAAGHPSLAGARSSKRGLSLSFFYLFAGVLQCRGLDGRFQRLTLLVAARPCGSGPSRLGKCWAPGGRRRAADGGAGLMSIELAFRDGHLPRPVADLYRLLYVDLDMYVRTHPCSVYVYVGKVFCMCVCMYAHVRTYARYDTHRPSHPTNRDAAPPPPFFLSLSPLLLCVCFRKGRHV